MSKRDASTISVDEFEKLFETHFHELTGFLFSYASSRDELKDWIQDIFIKLWERRDCIDFNHPSFKGYLLKTARNHALKSLQNKKRYSAWLEENLIILTNPDSEDQLDDQFFSKAWSVYNQALQNLPPRVLETWKLSKEEGLSYNEIADIMGVSVKTVEVQMSKAFQILREKLSEMKS